MPLSFLPAHSTDAEALSHLRHQVWLTTYRGIFPDEMLDNFDYAFHNKRNRQFLTSPNFSVYFLVAQGQRVGYLTLRTREPIKLQSLYLLEEHRDKGYGTQVFRFVRSFCRAQGVRSFTLDCHPDNRGALAFYRKMGGRIIGSDLGHENNQENGLELEFTL